MATILDFPAIEVAPRARKARRGRSSAEIVLFPGVRYERWSDDAAEPAIERDTRRRGVERDRLQLIE
jgi:hypothetical protein